MKTGKFWKPKDGKGGWYAVLNEEVKPGEKVKMSSSKGEEERRINDVCFRKENDDGTAYFCTLVNHLAEKAIKASPEIKDDDIPF